MFFFVHAFDQYSRFRFTTKSSQHESCSGHLSSSQSRPSQASNGRIAMWCSRFRCKNSPTTLRGAAFEHDALSRVRHDSGSSLFPRHRSMGTFFVTPARPGWSGRAAAKLSGPNRSSPARRIATRCGMARLAVRHFCRSIFCTTRVTTRVAPIAVCARFGINYRAVRERDGRKNCPPPTKTEPDREAPGSRWHLPWRCGGARSGWSRGWSRWSVALWSALVISGHIWSSLVISGQFWSFLVRSGQRRSVVTLRNYTRAGRGGPAATVWCDAPRAAARLQTRWS